jgi:hypothetical protein
VDVQINRCVRNLDSGDRNDCDYQGSDAKKFSAQTKSHIGDAITKENKLIFSSDSPQCVRAVREFLASGQSLSMVAREADR